MNKFLVFCFFLSQGLWAQNTTDTAGNKQGLWTGYHKGTNNLRYEGSFKDNKEVGVFKYYDDTKAKVVIATREFNAKDGSNYTIFYDQTGNVVSEGKIVNKEKEGVWKIYHKASKAVMSLENYSKGKLVGENKVFYKDGKILEIRNFKDGVLNGLYSKYSVEGKLLEQYTYIDGKIQGEATYYNTDGQVYSNGLYKDNARVGVWKFYKDGKVVKEVTQKPIIKFKNTVK
ncbi:MAG: hypothetical protein KBS98_01355 [Flavobacterium sp.]|nr:hypothetical protein [Candidatus Neoflavobacterium equi]